MSAPTAAPGPRQWTLTHQERPMTMNRYRTLHFHRRAAYDAEVRQAFGWLARAARIGKLEAVVVTAIPVCKPGSMPDVGACFPAAKAAIDGLVDAGVIVDDTPKYLRAMTFATPERGPRDLLMLVVEEAEK